MVETILTGHTSPETAYVVNDYPYGFTLRCKIRYWLEYKRGHGFRLVSQTTNPKRQPRPIDNIDRNGEVWNKPKASTYGGLAAMYLDEKAHVQWSSVGMFDDAATLEKFAERFADALHTEAHQWELAYWRRIQAARAKMAADRAAKEPVPVTVIEESFVDEPEASNG